MAKLNLKIPTSEAIKSLEAALKNHKTAEATYKTDLAKYRKEYAVWAVKARAAAKRDFLKTFSNSNLSISFPYYKTDKISFHVRWDAHYEPCVIGGNAPVEPKCPSAANIPAIENALRLLKLHTGDTVSTTTFNEVSKYF